MIMPYKYIVWFQTSTNYRYLFISKIFAEDASSPVLCVTLKCPKLLPDAGFSNIKSPLFAVLVIKVSRFVAFASEVYVTSLTVPEVCAIYNVLKVFAGKIRD